MPSLCQKGNTGQFLIIGSVYGVDTLNRACPMFTNLGYYHQTIPILDFSVFWDYNI